MGHYVGEEPLEAWQAKGERRNRRTLAEWISPKESELLHTNPADSHGTKELAAAGTLLSDIDFKLKGPPPLPAPPPPQTKKNTPEKKKERKKQNKNKQKTRRRKEM